MQILARLTRRGKLCRPAGAMQLFQGKVALHIPGLGSAQGFWGNLLAVGG